MMRAADIHAGWHALPEGGMDDVIGPGRCLIIAPHPDDESLGCGGLIARCVAARRPPLVAVVTDGAGSHNSIEYPPVRLRDVRAHEARVAVGELGLGLDRLHMMGISDGNAPTGGADFERAANELCTFLATDDACGTVLAPWEHDPHSDHVAVAQLARHVASRLGLRHLAYPVWGWTLAPDVILPVVEVAGWRLDISDILERKRRAIAAHRSQCGGLVTDDVAGFTLPDELLSACTQPFETYLES